MKNGFLATALAVAMAFTASAEGERKAAEATADLWHPYTFVSEVGKKVEKGEAVPSQVLWDAVRAARIAGNEPKARDFLIYLIDHDKGNSALVKRALISVIGSVGRLGDYKRLLEISPDKNFDIFQVGLNLLYNYAHNVRTKEFVELGVLLYDTFDSDECHTSLSGTLQWAAIHSNILGMTDGKAVSAIVNQAKKIRPVPAFGELVRQLRWQNRAKDIKWRQLYEKYGSYVWDGGVRESFFWSAPDDKALDLAREFVQCFGVDPKNPHVIWRFNPRLDKLKVNDKQTARQVLEAECRAGKYPAKEDRSKTNPNDRQDTYWWYFDRLANATAGKEDANKVLAEFKQHAAKVRAIDIVDINRYNWNMGRVNEFLNKYPQLRNEFPFEDMVRHVAGRVGNLDDNLLNSVFDQARKHGQVDRALAALEKSMAAMGSAYGYKSRLWANVVSRGGLGFPGWDHQKAVPVRPNPTNDALAFGIKHVNDFNGVEIPEFVWMPERCGIGGELSWTEEIGPKCGDDRRRRARTPMEEQFVKEGQAMRKALYSRFSTCNRAWGGWGNGLDAPVEWWFYDKARNKPEDPQFVEQLVAFKRVWKITNRGYYFDTLKILKDKGYYEVVYALLSADEETKKNGEYQKLRTDVAAHMPGLYPVTDKDPAYPLYVAADALQNNNPERAWSLLSANLKVFDADPLRYQPQFALWALEQFRKVRGENDVLRDKAWEHVEKLLANESSLPAEVAAGLFFLRAEIAEDRLNYEVAHAGYQQLRNHATYKKTEAGRKAMFRDVELMLTMGNLDGASQTAEQWIATPEPEIRAQGHYIMAKIAFQRKDYPEVRKELDKVFEIDFTHAAGRLLQGEWKLATNYEVDDTQVLLGDLKDRSAIRPGQPLSISVQDKNLSVAGGGASIPVLVKTSSGKDVEKVLLYPGTRDPSLFRGSIDSVLGVAKVGNSILELTGDDVVSYEVDPDFLKGRGLTPDEPKKLRVVDDAEMQVGSGEGEGDNRMVHNLRPGLPLRIEVRDRDRSRPAGAQTVNVKVTTSSGDSIKAAALKETGVDTGLFKTEIKTSIPPPRSFASDSLVGSGPEDLVSKARGGSWQSLNDGKKPKYVGVDTMTSHLVKTASLDTPAPEAITTLNLWGRLYGKELFLGSYPSRDASERLGIRVFSRNSNVRNRGEFARELSMNGVTSTVSKVWKVTANSIGAKRLVRALVYIEQDQIVNFRLKPLQPEPKEEKDEGRLRWFRAEFFLDGKPAFVYDGGGRADAHRRTFKVELEAGVHEFEIYAHIDNGRNDFELCQVTDEGELVSLPEDWTDHEKHPELLARASDKCKIVRTAEGYVATFDEPERLRALRWEVTDYVGNSVSASKLHVVNKAGDEVIPADHDYTEALGNDILEVAPGDTITVSYDDDVTSSGRKRTIERKLHSSFNDGNVYVMYEDITDDNGTARIALQQAYRIAPGDNVVASVNDADLDLTSGADTIKLLVKTDSGDKFTVKASEETKTNAEGEEVVERPGLFKALIRTALPPKDGKALKPGVIPLKPGDGITVSYTDEDNTNPGVPVERSAHVAPSIKDSTAELQLCHTWTAVGIDKSPEAKQKLGRIRRRSESSAATQVWLNQNCCSWVDDAGTNAVVSPVCDFPFALKAPALARHGGSKVTLLFATQSEIDAAAAEGREVEWSKRKIALGRSTGSLKQRPLGEKAEQKSAVIARKKLPDTFGGVLELYSSLAEERAAGVNANWNTATKAEPIDLKVGDTLVARFVDDEGKVVAEAKAKIATTGWIGLADSTYAAENSVVHLGETLHLKVFDPDRDVTDEQDEIEVEAVAKSGEKRTLKLKETMPRSGVFTCPLTPSLVIKPDPAAVAAEAEKTKNEAKGKDEKGEGEGEGEGEKAKEPVEDNSIFPSAYGDEITFTYVDETVGAEGKAGNRVVTAKVLPGSDGEVRSYSKRFRDSDQAVLVQFRLAECLFEMAKDYRKLKDKQRSAEVILEGRKILEAALRDYPNSSHAAEGEFLLANLYEQLAEEERQSRKDREKEGEDLSQEPNKAEPLYREAVARFSAILSAWPEGDYAARSQYHKALCLERLEDFARASEEYVKMTYLFPESPLVGDASVRLASYYYQHEKRYDIAGKIYTSFRNRFPAHPQAPQAVFMGGQCQVKRAETLAEAAKNEPKKAGMYQAQIRDAYHDAVESFVSLVENHKDISNKELLAQGLYWAGDCSFRLQDYANAYIYLKRTTFEYPESKWARYARGMLLQESAAFEQVNE